jgi:fructose-bisphosphate aldolase class II
MTLVSIKQQLVQAREQHYAVPLVDVYEIQGMDGTMAALTAMRAPTIIGVYSPIADQPNSRALEAYIRARAAETDVPISLMLDHGASVDLCLKVIEAGYTDVMYDGSSLPIEENIANTRRVVEAAHARGVGVEAELGHVGQADAYDAYGGQRLGFTDPNAVEYFVEQTGVDFLAIAFGNAHGLYKGEPHFDLDLVREIHDRVSVPLVMHGGTGTSDAMFRAVIAAGICKVNYATQIITTATQNMKATAADPKSTMFDMLACIRDAYAAGCSHLYEVFGAANRA